MKVRIGYTVNVDDRFRRAVNLHYGRPGLATREEVQRWFETFGDSGSDDLMYDLQRVEEEERQRERA